MISQKTPSMREELKTFPVVSSIDSLVRLTLTPLNYTLGSIMTWLRWVPSSKSQLQQAEEKVLGLCPKECEVTDVDIGPLGDKENCKIHTIKVSSSTEDKKTPLVLLHGLACGAAIFAPNIDSFSKNRDVYAIDMLGFGSSSRPNLSEEPEYAEKEMVNSIEEWRKALHLESFVMLGHSLGGYISTAYALSHPDRVKHLILEDPWGFGEYDPNRTPPALPLYIKFGLKLYTTFKFNPMSTVRVAGPYGYSLMRSSLDRRHPYFSDYFPDTPDTIPKYLYHANMRKPTGEDFFRNITEHIAWAKNPMINRFNEMDENIRTSFIHASNSFIPRKPSSQIQEERGEDKVEIYVVENAGHTIHLEKPKEFNELVCKILDSLDSSVDSED